MEDYVKRQIDLIGQMLLALAKKLGLIDGDAANYSMQSVQDEIKASGFNLDIDCALSEEHPIAFLVVVARDISHSLYTLILVKDLGNLLIQRTPR